MFAKVNYDVVSTFSDISGEGSRTTRIAFIDFSFFFGYPMGLFLSAHLKHLVGSGGCFIVSALFGVMACAWIILMGE